MYYGALKKTDIANGPGVRVTLFVSGCTHHCKECFQPETWDFEFGRPFTDDTKAEILKAMEPDFIRGITLLGGEPFEPSNQAVLIELLRDIKKTYPTKDIWSYSGYLLDEELLKASRARCEYTDEMLSMLDVLVDGEFMIDKKNIMLKFRGSENQRIIDVPASLKAGKVIVIPDEEIN